MSRSLVRNLRHAMRMIADGEASELTYRLRNKMRGVDLEFVSVNDLGLSPDIAHFHSSSGGAVCARVFRSLSIPPGSVAVDLGSGKGGALISLHELPFAEIIGVEVSDALLQVAAQNITRLGLTRVRLVHSDAASFTDLDRVTHIYMYNPFPCAVMARVLTNLHASLTRADRQLTMVYRNPVCDEAIVGSQLFQHRETIQPDEHAWVIYRHAPADPPAQ